MKAPTQPISPIKIIVATSLMTIAIIFHTSLALIHVESETAKGEKPATVKVIEHAQDKIREQYPEGDYSGLNNDVLHTVAFPTVEHQPGQAVYIQSIGSSLQVFPTSDGKAFSIVVLPYLGRTEICNQLIKDLRGGNIEISGVPLAHVPNQRCARRLNDFKITTQ